MHILAASNDLTGLGRATCSSSSGRSRPPVYVSRSSGGASGASGPGGEVLAHFGISPAAVADQVAAALAEFARL